MNLSEYYACALPAHVNNNDRIEFKNIHVRQEEIEGIYHSNKK